MQTLAKMRFGNFIKRKMRISINTKRDAIFLSVMIAFGMIITFILTGISTTYYAYEAAGGKPFVRQYGIIGPIPEPKPTHEVLGIDQLSILIIGTDEYLEYDPGRSDTIIWAYLDFKNKKVDVLSIPRDMVVWLPTRRPYFDKICHAYSYGGADLVKRAVEKFLGVRIDQVIKVDYNGFVRIIDTLGGVKINVDRDMDYDDNRGKLHIHIKKGLQVLDGRESLNYVRFRHDRMGDLGRIERQQKFMTMLRKKALRLEQIGRVGKVANIIADSTKLDPYMDIKVITPIILFFTKIDENAINFHSVPVARDVVYNDLASLAPYYSELDKLMRTILENNETEPESEDEKADVSIVPTPADFEVM